MIRIVNITEKQCSAGVISWDKVLYRCLHSASTIQTSISAWCSLYGVDIPCVLSLIQSTCGLLIKLVEIGTASCLFDLTAC